MKPNLDILKQRLHLPLMLALALMWGIGLSPDAYAQDTHPSSPDGFAETGAGHDHAEHAESDGHDAHDEDVTDEHTEQDGHEEHGEEEHDAHTVSPEGSTVESEEHDHSEHAEKEDEHDGHDHSAHAEEEEGGVRLTAEQRKRFQIVVQPAGPGSLRNEVSLPGEIVFNQDRVVHIVPRVSGIARDVHKRVGDRVKANEILAVIESRELADAKSEYLAAEARKALAEKTFAREKALHEEQVSSEQDYLEAEQGLAETRIALRSAEQKLHALGLPESVVQSLDSEHDEAITRYEIRSPITGVVTEKHISLGESLEANTGIFTVVDMSSVWVNLTVYIKTLGLIRPHQDVTLRVDYSGAQARGEVSMVTPFVDESTRSATARVVLDNSDGKWLPGTFVTGFINTSEEDLPIVVPRNAVQHIEGRDVVFVEHEGSFEMNPVTVGRADRKSIEIVAGLEPGTLYVSEGAFQLKATVITSTLGSHAGHGH